MGVKNLIPRITPKLPNYIPNGDVSEKGDKDEGK